jgi:putative SOS response-associated peptidase YedK
MCGRFTLHSKDRIKLKVLPTLDLPSEARYNIAPSQQILAIGDFGKGIEWRMLTWGLIPSWSTDGKGFINARAETLEERPSFSDSFRLRRCLIPADGFYEWKRSGKEKRPYYIHASNQDTLMFAGIWDNWKTPGGESILSCAIVTTEPNELVSQLHDRMPATLPPGAQELWLNKTLNRRLLQELLIPFPAAMMSMYPVSSRVNDPAHDAADLLARADAERGMTLSLFSMYGA